MNQNHNLMILEELKAKFLLFKKNKHFLKFYSSFVKHSKSQICQKKKGKYGSPFCDSIEIVDIG